MRQKNKSRKTKDGWAERMKMRMADQTKEENYGKYQECEKEDGMNWVERRRDGWRKVGW